MTQAKPYAISKHLVWGAYKRVKANRGAAGVDGQSLAMFERDLKNNLYKIWNRMSSGSYMPPAVRLVEIPKGNTGATRPLGIPTVQVHYTFFQQQFGIGSDYSPLPSTKRPGFPRPQKTTLWQPGDSDFALLFRWQLCSSLGVDGLATAVARGFAY